MPKNVKPNATSYSLIAVAKEEYEREAVRYFKEVCLRDGLEMRKELLNLISNEWVKKHPPPGNPQKQLIQYSKTHEESTVMCEVEGCREEAKFRCDTVFPFGRIKSLCQSHTCMFERRGELRSKKKL